jgi:hypothetical protein
MSRAGGEADKLGNRYEGIWTVDALVSVLTGEAQAISVEPIEPARGVEFVLRLNDGGQEFHSAKRQTTQMVWSLHQLASPNEHGRSILGDLVGKVTADPLHRAAFVSSTTANDLEAIREAAELAGDPMNFEARLRQQGRLLGAVETNLLPLLSDFATVWNVLLRMRIVGFTEPEMIRRVDQRIRFSLYRPDGAPVDAEAVRLALGDAVHGWLGRDVLANDVRQHLAERGWRERDWQRDTTVREQVQRLNRAYTELVEAELIHGTTIPRKEADEAIALLSSSTGHVAIIGAAGLGKSCTMAQIVHGLAARSIPHITLRLDVQTTVLTPDALGRALSLPTSPAVVLAGLSGGARSVLVIDQLDALSLVSGRNQHLWDVFEELLREAQRYPQMRVLLACREFDAENDHRLKRLLANETTCKRVVLAPLSLAQVEDAVRQTGVDPKKLTQHDLGLLQTPQNLSLFLQSGPEEHGQVGSVQALLNRYWDYKRRRVEGRIGRPTRWMEIVRTLANWLSDHQTLSAPADVLDEFAGEVEAMASEHVLAFDDRTCRFFHESVFDYVFARTYVAQGGTAAKLLLSDEQHLFRRGQVRQILAYNRDRDFTSYLGDLQTLLTDVGIRAHIKKVVVDWLRNLPDPRPDEWRIVQATAALSPVSLWWRTVPHGSIGWFDLLFTDGTWSAWLRSEDEDVAQRAVWLIGQDSIMRQRSDKVAELVEPLLDGSTRGNDRLRTLLRFSEPHHSRRMFDLFLCGIRAGWLDDTTDHWWHHLHDFPDKAPQAAVELLKVFLERQFAKVPEGDPFPRRARELHFPSDYCPRLAESAADAFLTDILPLITAEIAKRPVGDTRDELWRFKAMGSLHDFDESLLEGLAQAAVNLARDQPERFRSVASGVLAPVSHSLAFILLQGWTGNPAVFADDCARYLSQNSSRLRIGYDITSGLGGHGPDYLSRKALLAIASLCSAEAYVMLEAGILRFRNDYESPQNSGFAQMLLLANLPTERTGTAAKARLDELQRKFPDVVATQLREPRPLRMEFVPSPIPPEAMAKMDMTNWISAMRTYYADRMDRRSGPLRGSMHELARGLKHQVQQHRDRFAKMTLELPDDINPEYFDAILHGLVRDEDDDGQKKQIFAPVEMDALTAAIRRVHALPGKPCARSIAHAIGGSAKAALPDELLAIISEYAMHDPSPESEDWLPRADGAPPMWGGDPQFSGMNTGRGAAAWAISNVLFANPDAWPKLEAAVRAIVQDSSLGVRSCGVRCLLALLNVDRTIAVDLFLQLVDGASPVLGTGEVDNFIHHGIYPHYPKLRPLLLSMLKDADKEVRETAAQQITVASLDPALGADDLAQALAGGPECRAACAGVYAFNLRDASIRSVCREKLAGFFHDPEKAVRDEAATCFRGLDGNTLADEAELIEAYIKSPVFADSASQLMFALDEATILLPDVVCGIPERLIELQSNRAADARKRHDCYHLPELVLRLYRQTTDPLIRRRCLDTIDRMLAHGIGDIDSELGKVER